MDIRRSFGHALKVARKSRGLTQDDFAVVSSTNFISLLENGKTSPTLQKLEAICSTLNTHPVTLLALAYIISSSSHDNVDDLLEQVRVEIADLQARHGEMQARPAL